MPFKWRYFFSIQCIGYSGNKKERKCFLTVLLMTFVLCIIRTSLTLEVTSNNDRKKILTLLPSTPYTTAAEKLILFVNFMKCLTWSGSHQNLPISSCSLFPSASLGGESQDADKSNPLFIFD